MELFAEEFLIVFHSPKIAFLGCVAYYNMDEKKYIFSRKTFSTENTGEILYDQIVQRTGEKPNTNWLIPYKTHLFWILQKIT